MSISYAQKINYAEHYARAPLFTAWLNKAALYGWSIKYLTNKKEKRRHNQCVDMSVCVKCIIFYF